jgi:hypothetical protein
VPNEVTNEARPVVGQLRPRPARVFPGTTRRAAERQPRTVAAYRDSFRLLLQFAQQQLQKAPETLDLQDLDAPLVLAFLVIWSARATTRFEAAMRGLRRFDLSRILPRCRCPPRCRTSSVSSRFR